MMISLKALMMKGLKSINDNKVAVLLKMRNSLFIYAKKLYLTLFC